MIQKKNDTKVCCHKDDKVLLDDTKKIMIQKCVVIKMTKYFWKIKKLMIQKCVVVKMTKYFWMIQKNDTKVCCCKDDKVLFDDTKKNNDTNVCCHEDDDVKL